MRFELNEKVQVKTSGKTGEVTQYKHEIFLSNGVRTETVKYGIKFPERYYVDWHTEDEISSLDNFDDEFEINLLDLLIDLNLAANNISFVEDLYKRKQDFLKESGD